MAAPLVVTRCCRFRRYIHKYRRFLRFYGSENIPKKGIVLGVYENSTKEESNAILTPAAESFNKRTDGRLAELLNISGPKMKKGKSKVFYGLDKEYPVIAVVSLGKQSAGIDELEEVNESKENIRAASALGARQLRDAGMKQIELDPCTDAQAVAEGATLGLFTFDELKEESKRKPKVNLSLHGNRNRTKDWIENQKMNAFLSVSKGSSQPPVFLEMKYMGGVHDSKPLVLVGKGVTFDCGGISIKPSAQMDLMRGDMGGAAVVTASMAAIATLQLPINVVTLVPLCENMVNGEATRPGDVVTAMNGKTIQVDNTDAEGRLLLADALHYGCSVHKPEVIINVATLTGAIQVALGSAVSAVFTNSNNLWMNLHKAGIDTGDRLWRMPLLQHYTKQISDSQLADVNNIGKSARDGGACTAAAFLREFVTCQNWAHLDVAGVMLNKDEVPYLGNGMTGRPTRTLVEYVSNLSKKTTV
ncbi:cytosol aminopeptidase-like [Saccoglossus kowalevskii]|uniref:Cytosol aminopeptidase n=1 Tax=Saccoglossus kowalevskii TaxID=10224 RepID=A0ABM0MRR4_SACKO|nr:PREDICTED: cytosol aminopeptidase-like [Saccoglossus kowalevskii]